MRFEIPIKGKYTIIRGYSGTGKSTLIRTLTEKNSRIEFCMPVEPLSLREEHGYDDLEAGEQTLFYGDEDLEYLHSMEFQKAMAASKHCFLLVTRNKLESLAYAASDVLRIEMQNKVHRGVEFCETPQDIRGIKT